MGNPGIFIPALKVCTYNTLAVITFFFFLMHLCTWEFNNLNLSYCMQKRGGGGGGGGGIYQFSKWQYSTIASIALAVVASSICLGVPCII